MGRLVESRQKKVTCPTGTNEKRSELSLRPTCTYPSRTCKNKDATMRYRLKRVAKWISLLGESARSQNRRVERELDPWKRARSATLIFIMRRYTVQHYSPGAQASLSQSIARLLVSPIRVCRQSWLRLRRREYMVGRRGPFGLTCPKGHRQ